MSGSKGDGRGASASRAVILMGIPAAGKTALARQVASALGWSLVSRDLIRAAMFNPCSFSGEEKAAAFRGLVEAATVNALLGRSQIIEGMPFSRVGELEAVEAALATAGAVTFPVLCDCPVEVAVARARLDLGSRDERDRSEATVLNVHQRFRAVPERVFRVDTSGSIDDAFAAVLSHLQGASRR